MARVWSATLVATGASLTGVTTMAVVPTLLLLAPSLTCQDRLRLVPGLSLVEAKVMALRAASHWARVAVLPAEPRVRVPVPES